MTMPHEIKEADWKVLRRLHPLALEARSLAALLNDRAT
jgi:hypothetical protein